MPSQRARELEQLLKSHDFISSHDTNHVTKENGCIRELNEMNSIYHDCHNIGFIPPDNLWARITDLQLLVTGLQTKLSNIEIDKREEEKQRKRQQHLLRKHHVEKDIVKTELNDANKKLQLNEKNIEHLQNQLKEALIKLSQKQNLLIEAKAEEEELRSMMGYMKDESFIKLEGMEEKFKAYKYENRLRMERFMQNRELKALHTKHSYESIIDSFEVEFNKYENFKAVITKLIVLNEDSTEESQQYKINGFRDSNNKHLGVENQKLKAINSELLEGLLKLKDNTNNFFRMRKDYFKQTKNQGLTFKEHSTTVEINDEHLNLLHLKSENNELKLELEKVNHKVNELHTKNKNIKTEYELEMSTKQNEINVLKKDLEIYNIKKQLNQERLRQSDRGKNYTDYDKVIEHDSHDQTTNKKLENLQLMNNKLKKASEITQIKATRKVQVQKETPIDAATKEQLSKLQFKYSQLKKNHKAHLEKSATTEKERKTCNKGVQVVFVETPVKTCTSEDGTQTLWTEEVTDIKENVLAANENFQKDKEAQTALKTRKQETQTVALEFATETPCKDCCQYKNENEKKNQDIAKLAEKLVNSSSTIEEREEEIKKLTTGHQEQAELLLESERILKERVEKSKQTIAELKQNKEQEIEKEINCFKSNEAKLEEELVNLNKEVINKNILITDSTNQIENLQQNIQNSQRQHDILNESIEKLKTQITELEGMNKVEKNLYEQKQLELQEKCNDFQATIDKLSDENFICTNSLTHVKKLLEKERKQKEYQEKQIIETQKENVELNLFIKTQEEVKNKNEKEIHDLKESLEQASDQNCVSDLKQLQLDYESIETQLVRIHREKNEQEKEFKSKINKLETNAQESSNELYSIKIKLSNLEDNKKSLTNKYNQMENINRKTEKETESLKKQITRLNDDLTERDDEFMSERQNNTELKKELYNLNHKVDQLVDDIDVKDHVIEQLSEKRMSSESTNHGENLVQHYEEEIEKLTDMVEKLQSSNEKMQDKLFGIQKNPAPQQIFPSKGLDSLRKVTFTEPKITKPSSSGHLAGMNLLKPNSLPLQLHQQPASGTKNEPFIPSLARIQQTICQKEVFNTSGEAEEDSQTSTPIPSGGRLQPIAPRQGLNGRLQPLQLQPIKKKKKSKNKHI